jgi:biopolymer transport protein ExbB
MGLVSAIQTIIEKGGFASWFILISAGLLVVISLERLSFLYFAYSYRAKEALERVRQAVLKRDYTAAIQVCNGVKQAPELAVVRAGLLAVESGREAMKSSLGGAVLMITRNCEKRVSLIALIAGVSTLLGLLGTISGLIKTFEAIANADASQKGFLLGEGISEAMYATAAGLTVGIAAMIVHTLCTSKTDEIVGQSQGAGYQLITWIEESERSRNNG